MRIQHNIMAMNAYRNLNNNNNALSGNLEKLSSGYRINRAGDDAAGLAISEKMRAQITGLDVAQDNAQSGINLVQTAEGALTEVHDMLNRMYELAEQSANGTYDDTDRIQLQKEVANLKTEINRIADSANFNGINLLDGNLTAQDLTVDGSLQTSDKLITEGLEIGPQVNGSGSKGEYMIDLSGKFGTGDSITVDFATGINGGSTTTVTMGFGTEFSGATLEEQAQSIVNYLNGSVTGFDKEFTAEVVDGTSIKISAKNEGASTNSVANVSVKDGGLDSGKFAGSVQSTAGALGTSFQTAFSSAGWNGFLQSTNGAGTAGDITVGDKLQFNFKGLNGENLTVTLMATNRLDPSSDMPQFLIGTNIAETTKNITDALSAANFDDNADTIIDESKMTVGSLFTFTANSSATGTAHPGSIAVGATGAATGSTGINIGAVNVIRAGASTTSSFATATSVTAQVGTGTAAVTGRLSIGTGVSGNYSDGDKVTINATLADGSNISIDLVAGKDFELGTSMTASVSNLVSVLTSTAADALTVKVNGKDARLGEIFTTAAAAAGSGQIQVTNTNGVLEFTNSGIGTIGANASGVNSVVLTTAEGAGYKLTSTAGTDQTSASSSLTLKEGLEYGTTITIDGKNYELVQNEMDLSDRRNEAVVVDDITDLADVAAKLKEKLEANAPQDESGAPTYTVSVAEDGIGGQTLTIETAAKGSDVKAVDMTTAYGDKQGQLSFKFDADKVKDGSYFELNGQRFEFVAEGSDRQVDKDTIALNLKVDEDGKTVSTDKELAEELYNKIGAAGQANSLAEDGTITITSKPNADGVIENPKLSFYEGLTLQIGDTSESYNQLNVSIQDCHTQSLGIEDLDISTQTGAKDALNVIENAINYVSDVRGTLGATQNRLDHTINNLSVMEENIQDAEANIRDTDVAEEMMEYTKNNILIQSAQAMLAQANQVPQGVLQLLG